ncbi:hypothetical protein RAS1_15780 [Phycisphaerae bacterium RAS1]|nr:hypothetical protein RAS1_15780 [Phycisphaerae bacterium RAS1]
MQLARPSAARRPTIRLPLLFAAAFALALAAGILPSPLTPPALGQTILRVKPNTPAGDDGLSWNTAFDHLQDALTAAGPIAGGGTSVEVWVAAGLYKPDTGAGHTPGDPSERFEVEANIALYGGFSGTEATRSQRDFRSNLSVMSGDLNGDDPPAGFANMTDNSVVLVRLLPGAAGPLDGFTVRGGGAQGTGVAAVWTDFIVEGMDRKQVRNCVFVQNGVSVRTGLTKQQSTETPGVEVDNCRFLGNDGPAIEVLTACVINVLIRPYNIGHSVAL